MADHRGNLLKQGLVRRCALKIMKRGDYALSLLASILDDRLNNLSAVANFDIDQIDKIKTQYLIDTGEPQVLRHLLHPPFSANAQGKEDRLAFQSRAQRARRFDETVHAQFAIRIGAPLDDISLQIVSCACLSQELFQVFGNEGNAKKRSRTAKRRISDYERLCNTRSSHRRAPVCRLADCRRGLSLEAARYRACASRTAPTVSIDRTRPCSRAPTSAS